MQHMKLFMAYIGGSITGISIEAHDVCFVVAKDITEAAEIAKARWPGRSAHIDAIREVSEVDGYAIAIMSAKVVP